MRDAGREWAEPSSRARGRQGCPVGIAALAAALVVAAPAGADELSNLDADMPTTVEDAFAAAPGHFELQGSARYDRRHGRDTVRLLPQLQVGFTGGLQAQLSLPYSAGSGRGDGESGARAGVLYTLNREGTWLPAFALAAEAATPIGPGRRGSELTLSGIATKTLDPALDRRLHLDLTWLRALDPGGGERRDRYRVAVGYSQHVAPTLVAVLAYVRESREERRERDANIVEAGLRYQLTEAVTLGAGAGFGVGRDSPRFRGLLSLQLGFGGR